MRSRLGLNLGLGISWKFSKRLLAQGDMLLQLSDETSEFYTDVDVRAWPAIRPITMLSVVASLCSSLS